MERYFLHFLAGDRIIRDDDGDEFPDLQAVQAEAVETARDILAETIWAGTDLEIEAVLVMDEQGHEVHRVLMTAVLPKSLQQRLCETA
jgi:hypothetical protein